MSKRFPFRKSDGTVVWVTFAQMMDAELGRLTLPDGSEAVRARDLEETSKTSQPVPLRTECVSDALGFPERTLGDKLAHLKQSGIRGVEFRPDPDVKGFMQVVCDNEGVRDRYAKSRGFFEKNSRNGGSAAIGAAEIQAAKELVSRGRRTFSEVTDD